MQEKQFYIYVLTNKEYGVFYIGFTSNLITRIHEHKNELAGGFTKQFNLKKLIYYEIYQDPETVIKREKRLKRWPREWKIEAINKFNPDWKDLYDEMCQ
jgi:putative endonuclease